LRRLTLVFWLVLSITSCKRSTHDAEALVTEKTAPLVSVVNVNDPAAAAQLVRGFHALEAGTWRWTMKQFEVALRPPPGAAQNGARLNFRFAVPEPIVSKFGPATLSATINGLALGPETCQKSGNYIYTRDVPASALKGDVVVVQFTCDKGMAPSAADARELSLIAVSIGLEPK
jgi:hypothetical protein